MVYIFFRKYATPKKLTSTLLMSSIHSLNFRTADMEFKTNNYKSRTWLTKLALLLVGLALVLTAISYIVRHKKQAEVTPQAQTEQATQEKNSPAIQYQQKSIIIKPRDNLSKIFKRLSLKPADVHAILALKDAQALRQLKPAQELLFLFEPDGKLHQISYQIDPLTALTVTNDHGFNAHITKLQPTSQLDYVSSPVQGAVLSSAQHAGLSRRLSSQLINIFNDKINFNQGIKSGDRFAVLYKNYYVNDKKISEGDIEAAEFIHDNKSYRAVKFTDPSGNSDYYTPEGYTLKSPFLRYPIDHPRITSRFSLHRWHPILQMFCAHLGVDLAAPSGTPIKATSNGKVIFAGPKANYGNAIIIQHNQYSTLYAHLRGFAQGIKRGSNVKRGQVIARLGETGLATGPHVHYEFRINDTHYDPLKIKLPSGEMIAKVYQRQFFATAQQLFAKLDNKNQLMFAMESPETNVR